MCTFNHINLTLQTHNQGLKRVCDRPKHLTTIKRIAMRLRYKTLHTTCESRNSCFVQWTYTILKFWCINENAQFHHQDQLPLLYIFWVIMLYIGTKFPPLFTGDWSPSGNLWGTQSRFSLPNHIFSICKSQRSNPLPPT
jgi:hypothetical protein